MNYFNFLEEFRASAIPDHLTLANVRWVEGDEAIEILAEEAISQVQTVNSYVTQPAKKILERYEFAKAGGWVAWGTTLGGAVGNVAYFKAKTPRFDFEQRKRIKYESPAKTEALPILPCVDLQTAQAIYERYKISVSEGETFWQSVQRYNLPVAICEGFKKALSLIAHGIPAIAIRGITQWHRKGSLELHQAIADFATPRRTLFIVFDQDDKATTQRQVRLQALKLGAALEQLGCQVYLPTWDRKLGKGIDDVLYRLGTEASTWLTGQLKAAPSLAAYRQNARLNKALEILEQLNCLSYAVERATEGEYLPELPPLEQGKIHAIAANLNSGKTVRIGADWVKSAIAQGWNTLVLSPLNTLGEQTAAAWQLPHIHKHGTSADEQQVLWAEVSQSHGIVMCPDSLHRLPEWFWKRPVLLVLDEANQVIEHLCQGNTLKSRWADILERFTQAARRAIATGAIVLSEDGLPDRAVKFVQQVSAAESVRVFTHQKQGEPWNCTLYRGQASGFRARFLNQVRSGKKLLYVTSSQAEAKRVARAIATTEPQLKVIRIDSETNQGGKFSHFFEQPLPWLEVHQPDVLILSPSAKSGISIQGGVEAENAYFAEVWGHFPALATDTHLQLLGRFRPAVDRLIFCPDFLLTTGEESLLYPRAIQRRIQGNAKTLARIYGIETILETSSERAALLSTIETAVTGYLTAAIAVSGAQKIISHQALRQRLEASGHKVVCKTLSQNSHTTELWKKIQEEIWREDARKIATAQITTDHSPDWARRTLEAFEVSLETRIVAQKILWREEFPGVTFDDVEECYQALCKSYGAMRRGVILQAKAENLEAARESERPLIETILKGDLRALHQLPKGAVRATLIARLGVLTLLDGTIYHNQDPRAIAIKQTALHFSKEIFYWFRLQISDNQTSVQICNKLLRKLGVKGIAISRPGSRGQQGDRHWQVEGLDDPIRSRLLDSLRYRLSGIVSTTRKHYSTSTRVMDTPPTTHQNLEARGELTGLLQQVPTPSISKTSPSVNPSPLNGFNRLGTAREAL